ncbi:MAG: hypothetical protein IAE79_05375 [Anaerolinea sp.]|nr:hypothetical protein [Anaerolinea sp.]
MNREFPTQDSVTCAQVEANLFAYLQEDLPAARLTALQKHVHQCDTCAQALAEARLLDGELRMAANRQPTSLSPEASLRIQEQVYRRMRRALWFHRARDATQLVGALAVTAVSLIFLFLFGSRWVQFVATPSISEQAIAVETGATAVPPSIDPIESASTPLPRPTPVVEKVEAVGEERPYPLYLARLTTITPGQTPEEVAATLFAVTFAGDAARLEQLFVAMHAAHEPAMRLWLHVHKRCAAHMDASMIRYEVVPDDLQFIARVDVYQNDRYVGELKMRRLNGEWYTVFTTYPLLTGCRLPSP